MRGLYPVQLLQVVVLAKVLTRNLSRQGATSYLICMYFPRDQITGTQPSLHVCALEATQGTT